MIIIYSKENCQYCEKAKNLLVLKGIEHSVSMLGSDFELSELTEMFPEARTFPQIAKVGHGYIGGYPELETYILSTELSL